LDALAHGAIILDKRGIPVYLNAAAERWVRSNRELTANSCGIRAADAAVDASLQRLIGGCIKTAQGTAMTAGGSLTLWADTSGRALHVSVAPLRVEQSLQPMGSSRLCVLMYLSDGSIPDSVSEMLCARYGLTSRECRVAEALLEGSSVDEIATKLSVGRETVRTQIKAVYAKAGVRRQVQFIRLVLTHPSAQLANPKSGDQ
jgi:DNA-binding CsgD family transcriptional regulator